MHAEYAAQANRQTMASYIATLIADAEEEIARIRKQSANTGTGDGTN